MRKWALVLVLGVAACGCASSGGCDAGAASPLVTYGTGINITRGEKPGEFIVEARIKQMTYRRRTDSDSSAAPTPEVKTISAPTLTCVAGTPAQCYITSDDQRDGILFDVYIAKPGEPKDTFCLLTVREGGKVMATTEVKLPPMDEVPKK